MVLVCHPCTESLPQAQSLRSSLLRSRYSGRHATLPDLWFKSEKFVNLGRVNPRYQSVLEAADVIVGTSVLRKHRLCVCQIKFFCKFLFVFIFVVVKNFIKCFFQDQDGSRIPVAR